MTDDSGERRVGAEPEEPELDWMRELAVHYEQLRRAYPSDNLCIVFDIDGTILDIRHLVVNALLSYDREHRTDYFQGLRPEDISVHESRIERFLAGMVLSTQVRQDVLEWYAERLWSSEAILSGAIRIPASCRSFAGSSCSPPPASPSTPGAPTSFGS